MPYTTDEILREEMYQSQKDALDALLTYLSKCIDAWKGSLHNDGTVTNLHLSAEYKIVRACKKLLYFFECK